MKLTDGERLIVIMLAEVMEKLELDREIDPGLVKSLAAGGDDWAIKHKYNSIFGAEPPAEDVVAETIDILYMWGIIESNIAALTGSDAEEASTWHYKSFLGFDGNHDPHRGVAYTLIEKIGDFGDFHGRALNSHSQTSLPRYREMIKKFERHLEEAAGHPLSMGALRDLCS